MKGRMSRALRAAIASPNVSALDIALGRVGPSSSARAGGAKARRSGNAFQDALDAANERYDSAGVAAIERLHAPTYGWGESLRVGKAVVDYTGTAWAGVELLGVAFDAKVIDGKASFAAPHVSKAKNSARERARFFAQADYLLGRIRRHSYLAGFLLQDPSVDMVFWCGGISNLSRLKAGESIPVREKMRAARGASHGSIVPHLPHVPGAEASDYLRLIVPGLIAHSRDSV